VRIRPDSIIADHKAAEPSQGLGRVLGHSYEAALSCTREVTGANGRTDVDDIIRLLLAFGADPNQRGINDYTPLHMAVAERNPVAVQTLLDGGANPELRTRIDECETPLEMAEAAGHSIIARCWRAKGSRFAQPRHPERTTIR
jgi:ankyrin repeat protein